MVTPQTVAAKGFSIAISVFGLTSSIGIDPCWPLLCVLEASFLLNRPEPKSDSYYRQRSHDTDVLNLSVDRRVLRVTLNVKNGMDQIRALVAADNNLKCL